MIFIYNLKFLNNNLYEEEKKLFQLVSQKRQKKILGFIYEIDAKLCLYSELLIYMLLYKKFNIPIENIKFGYSVYGKPFLLDYKHIHFSISHTRCSVLCAISTSGEVGVDIEKIDEPPLEIMKCIFHKDEIDFVVNSKKKGKSFFDIWTKKEAYFKMLGLGIDTNIGDTNILKIMKYDFHSYEVDDYQCCICYNPTNNYVENIYHVDEKYVYDFFMKIK